jgi:glycerophosphoryl diester phosphodiesterase
MQWYFDQIISHRGASVYAPENTLVAFETAHALGSNTVEFDVMLSADDQAFIFHDLNLSRTTNGTGELGLTNSTILKTLDAGSWFAEKFCGVNIPTLEETLELILNLSMNANIEIKPYPGCTEQTTRKTLEIINSLWPKSKPLPLISSFDLRAMELCQNIAPQYPKGLLLHSWRNDALDLAKKLNCCSIHLSRRIATEKRIKLLKQHGYYICVYTIDQKTEAQKFISWGVDSIFSNDPLVLGSI